jgi:hypothetical protein
MSRERAAYELHIGNRTLCDYEHGKSHVPPDIALAMEVVYNDPILTAKYCAQYCPIGQRTAQPVVVKDLAGAVLGVVKSMAHMHEAHDRLIEIAGDGEIPEDEIPEFERVMDAFEGMERAIATLRLWSRKNLAGCQDQKERVAV